MAAQRICSVDGCGKKHVGRGMCKLHWQRAYRSGFVKPADTRPTKAFVAAALSKITDQCIHWPFALDATGYPIMRINGKSTRVHRHVCYESNGPAPAEAPFACHKCGNATCINPRCLYWGSRAQNAADAIAHGKQVRGERAWSAKLTEQDVAHIYVSSEPTLILAKRYGVSKTTIVKVRRGEKWRHVTLTLPPPGRPTRLKSSPHK